MPAAPLLSEQELESALERLPGWEVREGQLIKDFRCTDFMDALAFIQALALPAEEMNHHPDVFIHWRDVRLSLWTHAAGGLTRRDIRLAQAIEDAAAARSMQRR